MKKSELRLMIREIVKEELAFSIKEVVNELRQPTQPKKVTTKNENFTKNSVINGILYETAQEEEYKTLGGGTYDSSKMNEVLEKSYGNGTNNTNGNLASSMGVHPTDAPDFLTKDYRGLMKAIDKKQCKL